MTTETKTRPDATEEEEAKPPIAVADQEPEPDPGVQTPAQLFKYSTWVHVGPGSEECESVDEEAGECSCGNPLHFHAWCRLPNQFQHREHREKGLAAKARKIRQLRDPETDAYAILEEEFDSLSRQGDAGKAGLVDELLGRDWWKDYIEAVTETGEETVEGQDEDGEKLYEHVERDQARYTVLQGLPEDQRPKDEYDELTRHLAAYNEKVQKRVDELQKPRREALEKRDISSLIDEIRDDRIQSEGTDEFNFVYGQHEWHVGTLVAPGGERRFPSLEALQEAAPEVVAALKAAYNDLERTRNTERPAAQGNS